MAVREPYITLANKAAQHPKTVAMTDREYRVWINAMCYANTYLTDGLIPRQWFVMNAGEGWKAALEHMTELGVLSESPSGSLQVCNYLEYQRSRAQIEADISRKSAMGKASGEARRKKSSRTVRSTDGSTLVQPIVDGVLEQSCSQTHNIEHIGGITPQNEPAVQPCVEPAVQRGVEPSVEQNTEYRSERSGDGCANAGPLRLAINVETPRAKGVAKARKRPVKAPGAAQAGLDHQTVLAAFSEAFRAAKGMLPRIDGKEAKAAKELRERLGVDAAVALIFHCFTDEFFVERTASLAYINANVNRLMPVRIAPDADQSRTQLSTYEREMQLRAEEDARWDAMPSLGPGVVAQ